MNFFNDANFIAAVEQSFKMYKEHGARSTAKLKPIHTFFAETLKSIFGNQYEYHYIGADFGEMTMLGEAK